MTTPDQLAELLRLRRQLDEAHEELEARDAYKAQFAEQLKHVVSYLTDVIADLRTPIPDDAPPACQAGDHMTVAELPGKCALCGTRLPDGQRDGDDPTG